MFCSEAKISTEAGSSYSDIHDQEVLDSLSDRPLKGEGRLECQRASIIELLTSLGETAYEIGHIEKGDHNLCLK